MKPLVTDYKYMNFVLTSCMRMYVWHFLIGLYQDKHIQCTYQSVIVVKYNRLNRNLRTKCTYGTIANHWEIAWLFETNRQYTITKGGTSFIETMDPFVLVTRVGVMQLICINQGQGTKQRNHFKILPLYIGCRAKEQGSGLHHICNLVVRLHLWHSRFLWYAHSI